MGRRSRNYKHYRRPHPIFETKNCGALEVITVSNLDNIIGYENRSFEELSLRKEIMLDSKPLEILPFRFAGIAIQKEYSVSKMKQTNYINQLNTLPSDASFEPFRSLLH